MKIAKFTPPPTTPGGFRPTTREPNPGQDRVELGRTRPPEERWSLRKKAGLVAEGAMGTVDALSQVAPLVVLGTALGVVGGGVSNALLHTGLDSTLTGLVGTELGFLVAGYLCNRSLTQLPADLSAEQKLSGPRCQGGHQYRVSLRHGGGRRRIARCRHRCYDCCRTCRSWPAPLGNFLGRVQGLMDAEGWCYKLTL